VCLLRCPFCSGETRVVDKRDGEDNTRRRRECEACSKRFTTYERPEIIIMVVKKDGRREPYNRDKVRSGMLKACEKRSVSMDAIDGALDRMEKSIRDTDEITSKAVGEMVMKELRKIDKVAYIRFASVYREFDDIESFEKELKLLRR
jgi:transcriptional repressor NrdR